MRHRKSSIKELNTGVQKTSNVLRNILTSLITSGEIVTTPKRAKVLKSVADSFFAKLCSLYAKHDDVTARREAVRLVKRTVYTDLAGKKVVDELLPRYVESNTLSYVGNYKLGYRKGDSSEAVLLKLL